MNLEQSIRKFYDQNPFPGAYDLLHLKRATENKYINKIGEYVSHGQKILDIGCGTGLITNSLALHYHSEFTGIDFSTGVNIATTAADNYALDNVKFIKEDFFAFNSEQVYDVIIAQSFLTHVPKWKQAIEKMKLLSAPNGVIIVSIYNTVGKIIQRCIRPKYHSCRLQLDQECNPYETTFTHAEFLRSWQGYELLNVCPSIHNKFVNLTNIFNTANGGLTMYVFRNTSHEVS